MGIPTWLRNARVIDALMRLTIGRDKTGTVNAEDHILFQQVDVMNDLIVGTLEECGINTHHREHSLAGQTGRKSHSVLFCHANIKKALGVRMVEELQASAIFHGGGNGTRSSHSHFPAY